MGGMSEEEAFRAAIATWPAGVRPVVHWSEARDDKRPAVSGVGGPGALRGPRQRCLQWGAWVLTHTHTHMWDHAAFVWALGQRCLQCHACHGV